MEYLLVGLAFIVIVALLGHTFSGLNKKTKNTKQIKKVKAKNPIRCPICSSELYVGENLISKVYRPMNVPDQLMSIKGCPHCYPVCENGVKRICPVCHKTLSCEDELTARLFNKSVGKKHVHIVGCSKCHKIH